MKVQKANIQSIKAGIMKKAFILNVLILLCITSFAQQDPLFTQYTFNKLLVNPAYAGSREGLNISLVNRAQWINLDGAPNTTTLSLHSSGPKKKVGYGFFVLRDAIGPTANTSFMGTYSYRILMEKSTLSFGLQGGMGYFDFDWAAMSLKEADYLFDPSNVRKFTPDFNFGVYFQSRRFFAGLSSKHLLENEYGYAVKDNKTTFNKLLRHFYLMSGGVVTIYDKILFRPSTLIKFVRNAPLQIDINASILFKNALMIGASFRTEKAISLMTEIALMDGIKLGYSYDIYFNELQLYNYGSSEIRLDFDITLFERRMVTPRYF